MYYRCSKKREKQRLGRASTKERETGQIQFGRQGRAAREGGTNRERRASSTQKERERLLLKAIGRSREPRGWWLNIQTTGG